MEMPSLTYRNILKIELADRIAANPAYSLRAMARQVKVSPSLLSDLLKGKKHISAPRAYEIAKSLKFDDTKTEYFATLVQYETAKSEEMKMNLLDKLNMFETKAKTRNLDLDMFRTIAEWYHLPLLELTHVENFNSDTTKIAAVLGISKAEAEAAIDRLLRLELLERTTTGELRKQDNYLLASSKIPHQALRRYHEQMLQKASESLATQKPTEKFVGSETFAFDESQLKKATEIIEECFTKIIKLAATKRSKKDVYHMGVQLFRLTKKDVL